jgi:hypothetical protein
LSPCENATQKIQTMITAYKAMRVGKDNQRFGFLHFPARHKYLFGDQILSGSNQQIDKKNKKNVRHLNTCFQNLISN